LLIADKGGFIFESKPGVYEQVAEFDFVSLYPNIMMKKMFLLKLLIVIVVEII
jgi:DNA polymerase elongation subunit (family B)